MNIVIIVPIVILILALIIFTIFDFRKRKKEYRSDSTVDSDVYRNIGENKHVDG